MATAAAAQLAQKRNSTDDAVEETAQYSAIASLFLFMGLATYAFTSAGRTKLDDMWRKAGSGTGKGTDPTGVIVGYTIMGLCYSTAACFAAYVAYVVSSNAFGFGRNGHNGARLARKVKSGGEDAQQQGETPAAAVSNWSHGVLRNAVE